MRCERCGRFVGEEALEGWSGGLFGYYCAFGVGCNSVAEAAHRQQLARAFPDLDGINGPANCWNWQGDGWFASWCEPRTVREAPPIKRPENE